MGNIINMTGNTLSVIITGILQILIICWVYDTFKRTKQMIQSQDYTNQRIYEIEKKIEEIIEQQTRIEKQLKEHNSNNAVTEKIQN